MKAWRRLAGLLIVVGVAGCGGESEPEPAPEQADPPPTVMSEAAEPEIEVAPLTVEIQASASLRSDRRLMVQGETNLPDTTQLQVIAQREVSGVRWQSHTTVTQGEFTAGPFGPGSGLPDGGYTITVNLVAASVQPRAVRERIGEQGEHLAGELVTRSRHGLGQVASYSRRYLIGSEPRRAADQAEVLEVE